MSVGDDENIRWLAHGNNRRRLLPLDVDGLNVTECKGNGGRRRAHLPGRFFGHAPFPSGIAVGGRDTHRYSANSASFAADEGNQVASNSGPTRTGSQAGVGKRRIL